MMRLSPQRPVTVTLGKGLADALACVLVLLTLLASPDVSRLTVGVFVSVPLEALLGVAVLLALPGTGAPGDRDTVRRCSRPTGLDEATGCGIPGNPWPTI